jgi:hypothetical protein
MKKVVYAVLFGFCGLISVCIAIFIAGRIDLEGMFPRRYLNGCWEADRCRIPLWYWIGVASFITSPILAFVYRGYCLSKNRISIVAVVNQIGILLLMTVAFGVFGRAIAFFAKTA